MLTDVFLEEDRCSAWMKILEFGHIKDFGIDNYPLKIRIKMFVCPISAAYKIAVFVVLDKRRQLRQLAGIERVPSLLRLL